jgi:hypothetical protein
MTRADLDDIKWLLADYRESKRPHNVRARARLETALVKHADALIAAAECALRLETSGYVPDEAQATYVAEAPA